LNFGRLLSEAKSNPIELLRLNSRQFEEMVAEIWQRFGYLVERTSQTRDGGRDIIAIKQTEANLRFLIECKRYERRHKVGVGIVRELYGVRFMNVQQRPYWLPLRLLVLTPESSLRSILGNLNRGTSMELLSG